MGLASKTLFGALLLTIALGAQAQERPLTKKELPAAVLAAFQKMYPKATIKGLAEEKKDGKTYYEIESKEGKTERDLLYLADGSVAEIEESMPVEELPLAVKRAVDGRFPKAKIAEVEKVTQGSEISYGVKVKASKGRVTLDVAASGKVLKEEAAKGHEK